MKNLQRIEDLLNRYWEGETTLDEERELKVYFSAGAVDERFRAVAPMFRAFREEQAVELTPAASAAQMRPVMYAQWTRLAAAASVAILLTVGLWLFFSGRESTPERMAQQNPIPQPAPLPSPDVPQLDASPTVVDNTPPPRQINQKPKARKKNRVTPPDPETEQAMEEVKAAFALLSSKLSKSRREAVKGAAHMDNLERVFKKKEG